MGKVKHSKEFITQLMKEVDETGNASIVGRKHNINFIEDTEKLGTKLENVKAIRTYAIIYYISKFTTNKKLKVLYKYMYYLSDNDKAVNPMGKL